MSKKKKDDDESDLKTCAPDPRYHNQNVTTWCYSLFVDYHKCTRLLGEKHEPCDYFYKCLKSICPNQWVAKWEEQIQEGTFPVKLPEKKDQKKK